VLIVDGGPLPDGVEVLELNGWSRSSARADLVIDAATEAELVAAELPERLADARAEGLARRALERLAAAIAVLDEQIDTAEAGFAARIARLESTRISDPDAHVAAELARLRPVMLASVGSVMEHGAVHLGSELALLRGEWTHAIEATTTREELHAAAATIDERSAASVQRIAGEVRMLVMGGLGGCAHDIVPGSSAAVPAVDLLPSLTQARGSALDDNGWLSGMFRTFDSRRADALQKVDQRLARLDQVAAAELLDAEPLLHAALDTAVATAITAAATKRTAALDREIAAEQEAIAAERETLAPLVQVREGARNSASILLQRLEYPAYQP
jgi:hypothetical protein